MNEISDAKSVVLWLFGALMGLMAWFGKRQVSRIDDLEEQVVTREELSETLALLREDRLRMHNESREELRYIRNRLDGMADRQ